MGLRHLEWHLLLLQFGCQLTILFALLGSVTRRGGLPLVGRPVLHVLGIALGSVLIEKWLGAKLGFLVVIPVLGITVLVLRNASWSALWVSCLAVSVFSLCYQLAVLDLGTAWKARRLAREEMARRAALPVPVFRYEQVADELDFGRARPKPANVTAQDAVMASNMQQSDGVAGDLAGPTAVTNALFTLASGEIATPSSSSNAVGAGPAVTNEPPPPPPPPKPDWSGARKGLVLGGEMVQRGGKRLTQINGRLYEEGESLGATHAGFHHSWRVAAIQPHDVDLEELSAVPVLPP